MLGSASSIGSSPSAKARLPPAISSGRENGSMREGRPPQTHNHRCLSDMNARTCGSPKNEIDETVLPSLTHETLKVIKLKILFFFKNQFFSKMGGVRT
jgi:hypothetical protein